MLYDIIKRANKEEEEEEGNVAISHRSLIINLSGGMDALKAARERGLSDSGSGSGSISGSGSKTHQHQLRGTRKVNKNGQVNLYMSWPDTRLVLKVSSSSRSSSSSSSSSSKINWW